MHTLYILCYILYHTAKYIAIKIEYPYLILLSIHFFCEFSLPPGWSFVYNHVLRGKCPAVSATWGEKLASASPDFCTASPPEPPERYLKHPENEVQKYLTENKHEMTSFQRSLDCEKNLWRFATLTYYFRGLSC